MRPTVRPPPKVVPPKPPAHLFEPSNSFDRDHVRGMPSPRYMGDLNAKHSFPSSNNNYYDKDVPFHPSHGPPQRTLADGGPGKYLGGPSDRDRTAAPPLREQEDFYRQSDSVPLPSSKMDFDKDVAEQMKRLEEDMLKLMIENGELQPPPSHGVKHNVYDDYPKDFNFNGVGPHRSTIPPLKQPYDEARYNGNPSINNNNRPLHERDNIPTADSYSRPRNQPWDQPPKNVKESPRMNDYDNISQHSRGNPSPARRKGAAIGNLYETDDHLRMKAEKQALYSQQLQQQMREKAVGNSREPERRIQQVETRNQRLREEGGGGGLAIGMDKNAELELKRQKQQEYKMQLDQQSTRKPKDTESGTGLALGMDKDREAALRRQKQLEYRQQLDQQSSATVKSVRNNPQQMNGGYPAERDERYQGGYETRHQASEPYSKREISPRYEYPPQEYDQYRRFHEPPSAQFDSTKQRTPSKSITNPLSLEEKESKRSKQDDYRKQLDQQKRERERQKEEEKKKVEEDERRFMSQFENSNTNKNQDLKLPAQQQQQSQQPTQRVHLSDHERNGDQRRANERAVSFDLRQSDYEKRVDNDYDYDRRQPPPRQPDVDYAYDRGRESSSEMDPYYDQRQMPRSYNRDEESRGNYEESARQLSTYEKYDRASDGGYQPNKLSLAEPTMAESSPSKSPKPARNQLVQDIYGRNSILSHRDENVKDSWKPSGKNNNDRQRAAINEQKAALDRQKEENKRLKDEELRKQKEEEEKLEKKIRAEIEAEQEHARLEREKKQKLAQDNQREMEDLQQRKEKEALARKGLTEVNKAPMSNQKSNVTAPNNNYDHIKSPLKSLVGEYDREQGVDVQRSPPRQNYRSPPNGGPSRDDAIDSFVRNYEQKKSFMESPKRVNNPNSDYSRNTGVEISRDYELPARGYEGDHRPYNHPPRDYPPRENSFRQDPARDNPRDYPRDYPSRDIDYPPRGYQPNRDGYGGYRVDDSYTRDIPSYGMAGDGSLQRNYQKQAYYPHGDVSSSHPQRGFEVNHSHGSEDWRNNRERGAVREEANDPEVSFVSESRFVPANPWSSDIVSSLLPLHSVPDHIRKTKGDLAYVPPFSTDADATNKNKPKPNKTPVDLEQSLASESLLMYVGPKTPNAGIRNPRAEPITSSPPMKVSISATLNKEVVTLKDGNSGLSQTGLGRSKTPERLDPASLPVAGRPTSRHDNIEVKRVIAQPIVPSADEVPSNRIFVNKAQNSSPLLQLSNPPPRNLSHRYPEPSDTYSGRDDNYDIANPSLEHKADDLPQRYHRHNNVLKANSEMLLQNKLDHRSPVSKVSSMSRTNDTIVNDRESGSRPSSNHRSDLISAGSRKGWDISNESRNETIKQLAQHIGQGSNGDDVYEESFESA